MVKIKFDEQKVIASLFVNRDINYPFHLNHNKSKPLIAHTYPDYPFEGTELVSPGALNLTGLEAYLFETKKTNSLVAGLIISFPKPAVLKNGEIEIDYNLKPRERDGAMILHKIQAAHSVHPENRDKEKAYFTERNIKGSVFLYDISKELTTKLEIKDVDYDDSKKEERLKQITNQKNIILMKDHEKPNEKIFDLEALLGKKQKEKFIKDTDGKQRLILPEVKGLFSGKKPLIVLDEAYGDMKGVYVRNNRIHSSETYEFDYGEFGEGMLRAFCNSIGISMQQYKTKYGDYLCPSLCSALFIPAYGNFVKREEQKWVKDAMEALNIDSADKLQSSGVFARQSLVSDLRHLPKLGSEITVFVNYQTEPKQRARKGSYMVMSSVSASIFDDIGRPAVAGSAMFLGYISKKED